MPKILFTKTSTVQQGDGLGETFEEGKVYDLPMASCERWRRRGAAVDAPAEAVSEKLARRIVSARRGKFDVIDADGKKINTWPLAKAEAEALAAAPLESLPLESAPEGTAPAESGSEQS